MLTVEKERVNKKRIMRIRLFNFWYFFWIVFFVGIFILLYFLLRNKKDRAKRIVLFSILIFALVLHFLKFFIPPYSDDISRLYRDSWFTNICAANIFIFPFIFASKNNTAKDYMFYIGVISGIAATLLPLEPINKVNQTGEVLDIIRFYVHHSILWIVPLLMVVLKLHKIDYKRVWKMPGCLLLLLLFIMLNQIIQSELGFVPLRDDNFFQINYKNSSYIWGPNGDEFGRFLSYLCPNFFKTVPVGKFAGRIKYWPWFWLIVPAYVLLIPLMFFIALIFEKDVFRSDMILLRERFRHKKCK